MHSFRREVLSILVPKMNRSWSIYYTYLYIRNNIHIPTEIMTLSTASKAQNSLHEHRFHTLSCHPMSVRHHPHCNQQVETWQAVALVLDDFKDLDHHPHPRQWKVERSEAQTTRPRPKRSHASLFPPGTLPGIAIRRKPWNTSQAWATLAKFLKTTDTYKHAIFPNWSINLSVVTMSGLIEVLGEFRCRSSTSLDELSDLQFVVALWTKLWRAQPQESVVEFPQRDQLQ